jgi:hypothetical protein
MRTHNVRRIVALASLAACGCAFSPATAAPPEPPDDDVVAKAAANDTSRFLPRWLHLHGAAGLGWLASPEWMRKFYQAGQGYEAGLEIRPAASIRLRLNGEYQSLPAVTNAEFSFVKYLPDEANWVRDTIVVETRANGWLGSARLEAQWGLTPHLWLLGGFGRGYLETGLFTMHPSDPFKPGLELDFPGSSGWTWLGTAGASYEFELFGPRLSAEVRSSYLMRDIDRFQSWSIRIGWGGY